MSGLSMAKLFAFFALVFALGVSADENDDRQYCADVAVFYSGSNEARCVSASSCCWV